MDDTKKVIKDRKIAPESLIARIEKLSLAEKLGLQTEIKKSIEKDRQNLEAQLKLINNGQG